MPAHCKLRLLDCILKVIMPLPQTEILVHDEAEQDQRQSVAESLQQMGHPVTAEGIRSPAETPPPQLHLNEDGKIEDQLIPELSEEDIKRNVGHILGTETSTSVVSDSNLGLRGVFNRVKRMIKPHQEVVEKK